MIEAGLQSYFDALLHSHVKRFFDPVASEWLRSVPISFVRCDEIEDEAPAGIYLLTDLELTHEYEVTQTIPFNGTRLTTWEPTQVPGPTWRHWPNDEEPLFYRSRGGALVPTWNMMALCLDLLSLGEERRVGERDSMGRFVADSSPRQPAGLLDVPAVNDAIAAIVLAAGALATGFDTEEVRQLMRPRLQICLSHDLDQLRGNDRWTQGARGFRLIQQARSRKRPDLTAILWMTRNAIRPWTYYEGNVRGMLELEMMLGFRSTLYFLNGRGGRFGARSGSEAIDRLMTGVLKDLPGAADYGVHYNFDTGVHPRALSKQIGELTRILGQTPTSGRAHYLRLMGFETFQMWHENGIRVDETVGFPDAVGYRAGIAGPFHPVDVNGEVSNIVEMPLVVMDGPLLSETDPLKTFSTLVHHLGRVGGAISLLFHPGVFDNPEVPEARFLYRRLLESARREGAQSCTATQMVVGPPPLPSSVVG